MTNTPKESVCTGDIIQENEALPVKSMREWSSNGKLIKWNHTHPVERQKPTCISIPLQAHTMRSRTSCESKANTGSASHCRVVWQDHTLAVKQQKPSWSQHLITGSYNEISHTNCGRKKVNKRSASRCKLVQQDHAPAVEQRPMWGQHPMEGSYDEITHNLRQEKRQHGLSFALQAHTTRWRTSYGKTKADMGQHPIAGSWRDHTLAVEGHGVGGVSIPFKTHTTRSRTICG